MIRREDYEGLTIEEIARLINEHRLALKILTSLYAKHRAEREEQSDLDINIDILIDSLGYNKQPIIKADAKELAKFYTEETVYKKKHSKRSVELIATAVVAEVLDYHDCHYELNELLDIFGISKKAFFKEKERVEEFADAVYWKYPKEVRLHKEA